MSRAERKYVYELSRVFDMFFLYYAVLHFSVDEPVSYHLIVASVLLPTVSVLQAPASSL